MAKRAYIETTIFSYLAARPSRDLIVAARQEITRDWWEIHRRKYELFISPVVLREVEAGDEDASRRRLNLTEGLPLLAINDEAVVLAIALTEEGPLPRGAADDAFHGMDFLLTWNCRHLANAELSFEIQETLASRGYRAPVICTPEELQGG
jgi:hypothetical protein